MKKYNKKCLKVVIVFYVLLWVLFGVFSALLASGKNRSGAIWFFIGLFFGPFGLLVAFLPEVKDEDTGNQRSISSKNSPLKLVCDRDSDEDWEVAKQQLTDLMAAKGIEHVKVDTDTVYMLKKGTLENAYVSLERREGAIFIEFYNIDEVLLPIAEVFQSEQEMRNGPVLKDTVSPTMSIADEIEKLHNLKEKGILTDEEFTLHKAKLIN